MSWCFLASALGLVPAADQARDLFFLGGGIETNVVLLGRRSGFGCLFFLGKGWFARGRRFRRGRRFEIPWRPSDPASPNPKIGDRDGVQFGLLFLISEEGLVKEGDRSQSKFDKDSLNRWVLDAFLKAGDPIFDGNGVRGVLVFFSCCS
jgi:hypothetical protein